MKIISWNVNGLRSLAKQGFWNTFVKEHRFDVLCLQETKSEAEQLPEDVRTPYGLYSFFSSSKVKKGYSGVATYTKEEPSKIEYGLGEVRFDDEGRVIASYFEKFVIINVYIPNGGQGPHRLAYKYDFLDALLMKMDKLRSKGFSIVLCGDINIAHEAIDLARPEANEENTGFLPEERAWIDELLNHGYVDIFRHMHPKKASVYTYWDMKSHARDRNVGWRIDTFFISSGLVSKVKNTSILFDVYGSDHCPIELVIS